VWIRSASAALSTALLAVLSLPPVAGAQNVMLTSDRSCYGPNQVISLTGYGFTPDGDVALSTDGQQLGIGIADYDGVFSAELRAPRLPFATFPLRFTATDRTYLLNRASTSIRLTSLGVAVTPATGSPARPRRIRARGFFNGGTLYAHVRHSGNTRNVRIGDLHGPCRRLDVTRRLFRGGVRAGAYTLHFDTSRRYYPSTRSRVSYSVRIASTATGRRAAAAALATARWVRLAP
jgi:hypothetical protein